MGRYLSFALRVTERESEAFWESQPDLDVVESQLSAAEVCPMLHLYILKLTFSGIMSG